MGEGQARVRKWSVFWIYWAAAFLPNAAASWDNKEF